MQKFKIWYASATLYKGDTKVYKRCDFAEIEAKSHYDAREELIERVTQGLLNSGHTVERDGLHLHVENSESESSYSFS